MLAGGKVIDHRVAHALGVGTHLGIPVGKAYLAGLGRLEVGPGALAGRLGGGGGGLRLHHAASGNGIGRVQFGQGQLARDAVHFQAVLLLEGLEGREGAGAKDAVRGAGHIVQSDQTLLHGRHLRPGGAQLQAGERSARGGVGVAAGALPMAPAAYRAVRVCWPAMPSAARLLAFWKLDSALAVWVPKMPSALPVR